MPSKPLLAICIVCLAFVLGYLVEPSIRPMLELAPDVSKKAKDTEQTVAPTQTPEPTPDYDLSGITQEQLPPTVTLKQTSNFKNTQSGLTITMDAGRSVRVIGLEGDMVLIAPPGMDYTVRMPAERTNLVEQLITLGIQPGAKATTPDLPDPVTPTPVTPTPVTPTPVTPTPVTPTPVTPAPVTPAPVTPAPVTPAPVTPTPVTPTPVTPTPVTPIPVPTPVVAGPQLSEAQIVTAMQNHLKSGALKEFGFDAVTTWKAGPSKELDGVALQTGIVTYTTQTLFGSKTLEAQAFISNGKVIKWVWPKSGITLE